MFLGWAGRGGPPTSVAQSYELRFRVPRVKPGAYAFVIFCDACAPGPSGSLIADFAGPNSGKFLQVRPEQRSASSSGGGADRTWLIAGAAVLAFAAAALFLRRRAQA